MSSDLKDARWQLACDIADADGFEWVRAGYLGMAQGHLNANPERIPALAEKWREHL